ncbi:MAG TPA: hypothetical protein VMJ10_32950 [Kofleriaceae bacterium]|nr:hypothetical protein [Kofleriaceae bacterium]
MARATEELLAAYVDGVAELTADERERVEELLAADETARADADGARELLGQLRALPGEGTEPDWGALERQIRGVVGATAPRPWWRRWTWLAPVGALAATAAGALLWLHSSREPEPSALPAPIAHVEPAPAVATPSGAPLMWLDGDVFDLDQVDPTALDDQPAADPVATGGSDGLLPETDLGWVDQLDDTALDRAETWLATHGGKNG